MPSRRKLWLLILAPFLLGGVYLFADWYSGLPPGVQATYVGHQSCVECHQPQFERWRGSHHDLAMDHATEETVLGNFDDQTFVHRGPNGEDYGVTSTLFRRDGKFFINTEGPDGEPADYEIKFTFGVTPLQQYLVEMDHGRLQALSVAWNTEQKEWFLLDTEGERIRPDDPELGPLHWTGRAMNWNHMCADCHSTNLRKNFDLAGKTYHTEYSEIDVSCEACHGPGSIHVDLARGNSLFWDRTYGYGLAKLKVKDNKPQIETCAKCHSRRHVVDANQRPGHEYLDHYIPELLDTRAYHVDGQILPAEETYVYGSFLQSKMYRKEVRCSDCHDPHSAKTRFAGNKLCAQCHEPAKFDTPGHTMHKIGSAGASCVECHMPATTYMLVDPRRDHSIRVPRPDLTVQFKQRYDLDVPNACNRCHTKPEEDAAWAAAKVAGQFGNSKRMQQRHYGEVFAAARRADPRAEKDLLKIASAAQIENYGPIVRATAVSLMGGYRGGAVERALGEALTDREPLLRFTAVRTLQDFEPSFRAQRAMERLTDSVRAVRTQAALVLSTVPFENWPRDAGEPFNAVFEEYVQRVTEANGDQPGAHYELGLLYSNLRELDNAEREFELTLEMDPYYQRARGSLAALYRDRGERETGEQVLRTGVELFPRMASAQYELGLYLAEDPRQMEEATQRLGKAAEIDPEQPLFQYNYGMALGRTGKLAESAVALGRAVRLAPQADSYLLAWALVLAELGKWEETEAASQVLLQRSLSDESNRMYARFLISLACEHLGRDDDAGTYGNAVSNEFLQSAAIDYQVQRRWRLAMLAARRLLSRAPRAEVMYLYGIALRNSGRPRQGAEVLARVPTQLILQMYGQAMQNGRLVLARDAIEELLRRDPTNTQFQALFEQLGKSTP